MAVPRNRHSNARKNSRRAHHAKVPKQVTECFNCKATKLPHTICTSCGAFAKGVVYSELAS